MKPLGDDARADKLDGTGTDPNVVTAGWRVRDRREGLLIGVVVLLLAVLVVALALGIGR